MNDDKDKLSLWGKVNVAALLCLIAWSWFEYGRRAPLNGPIAYALAVWLISVLGESLYSGEAGFSISWLALEGSRDGEPFTYWFLVSLNVLFIIVVFNLA